TSGRPCCRSTSHMPTPWPGCRCIIETPSTGCSSRRRWSRSCRSSVQTPSSTCTGSPGSGRDGDGPWRRPESLPVPANGKTSGTEASRPMMTDFDVNSYSDEELHAAFDRLFPGGFAGPDVLQELAPGGWEHSPLLAVFHPSVDRLYEETLSMHRNLD